MIEIAFPFIIGLLIGTLYNLYIYFKDTEKWRYHFIPNKIQNRKKGMMRLLTVFNWGSLLLVLGVWPIGWILSFLLLLPLHEFGHYVIAKIDGSYLGWGIIPTPFISTRGTLKDNSPLIYTSGILFSLLAYPLFLAQGMSFLLFWTICMLLGSADLLCLIIWYRRPWVMK